MSNFNFDAILSAASAQAFAKQNNAGAAVHELIGMMQGLDEFSKRGKSALINVNNASKMWLSEELLEEYIPASFHWQLPSDTVQVSGVLVCGMPFSIDEDGFKPAPKSEWDATMAQGNGQTSRLLSYYNKSTKSWVDYPIVRPDFAALGFLTKDGQVWNDKLVKHPYEPSRKKEEGQANWSIKLSQFSPNESEGNEEWQQLNETMAANIRKYAKVGRGSRWFGYMLLVGYVSDVHLHLPSNAKKENSDEYEYDQKNGQMLSVTMPAFGVYVRPLTWRLDTLRQVSQISSYIYSSSDNDTGHTSTPVALNKVKQLINKSELCTEAAQVRVTVEAPKPELPKFWYNLSTVSKLAICYSLSGDEVIKELALEVIKGADLGALMKERGLRNSFLLQHVLNKNLIPVLNKTGFGAAEKAEAYFLNKEVNTTPDLNKVSITELNKPKSILKDLNAKKAAAATTPTVSVEASPQVPAPAAVVEEAAPASLIKRVRQRGTVELEDCDDKVIKPSGKRTMLEPEVKPTVKRSELDDYGVQFTKHNVDLAVAAAEFANASSTSSSTDEVAAVEYQEFDLDSL